MGIRLGLFAGVLGAALLVGSAANASVLYSNGPIDGTDEGWTINYGYSVSDSFELSSPATANSATVGIWNFEGDNLQTVDWSIGTSAFGNDIGSGTATTSDSLQFTNEDNYDIYADTFSLPSLSLSDGATYWLTLQNAVTTESEAAYWDQNSGPSSAQENTLGTIPSESFAICDTGTCAIPATAVPEPSSLPLLLAGLGLIGGAFYYGRKKAMSS